MEFSLPEGFGSREEAIEEMIRREIEAGAAGIRVIIWRIILYLLHEKGYEERDLVTGMEFSVPVGEEEHASMADILAVIENRPLMVFKCAVSALPSRERHALALARVVDDCLVPVAVVSDGTEATVLDTASGAVMGQGLSSVPARHELALIGQQSPRVRILPDRLEKERRILLAFDSIACSHTPD